MKRVLMVVLCALFAGVSPAQDDPVKKQERAQLRFKELHERMQKLQALLATTEPEQAKAVGLGNRHIQETQLHEKMKVAKELIESSDWDPALAKMEEIKKDLNSLLDLLLNRNLDLKKLLEEIARLENFLKRVDQLAKEQQGEKESSATTEALEQHLKDIEASKQKLDEIAQAQKELKDKANQAGMAAEPKAASEMAGKQGDLKSDTEKLQEQLKKLEADASKLGAKKDQKEGEPKPGSPGSGACSGSCQGAAGAMGKSQQQLNQNQPERSLQDQEQALKKLAEAKKALEQMSEEAKRKLLALPFEQQIRAQEVTKIETDKLAGDMDKSEQPDQGGEKKSTPGKDNVQNAVPMQKAAAGQLKEYKAAKAKQEQQDAKDQLDEAKKKLEDALAQLRQQLQDDVLRSLEERFGAMLTKQKEISARTKTADRLRAESLAAAEAALPEAIALRIVELASGENDLVIEADDALKLLVEEGSTAVFPEMVQELKLELSGVSTMLKEQKTAVPTQSRQADIEEMLKVLIDALRKTIELKENGGECGH